MVIWETPVKTSTALIPIKPFEEGLAFLDSAFDLSPRDQFAAPMHVFRAFAYSQLDRYEEAEEASLKAVELMGGCPGFWMEYTNALAENGKYEEAQNALAELRRLSPKLTFEHLGRDDHDGRVCFARARDCNHSRSSGEGGMCTQNTSDQVRTRQVEQKRQIVLSHNNAEPPWQTAVSDQ